MVLFKQRCQCCPGAEIGQTQNQDCKQELAEHPRAEQQLGKLQSQGDDQGWPDGRNHGRNHQQAGNCIGCWQSRGQAQGECSQAKTHDGNGKRQKGKGIK